MTEFNLPADGVFLGRIWSPQAGGPSVVTIRDGAVVDITSRQAPTVRDICEMDDPAGYVSTAGGMPIGTSLSAKGWLVTLASRPVEDPLDL